MTQPTGRCDLDLEPFITGAGGHPRVKPITGPQDELQGPTAFGKPGDFLLENEQIRVVIQGPGRVFGPQPFGGTILDADLVRADGGSNDQLGEIGLLYNFGRTVKAEQFDVLADGSDGRAAILAASGNDEANDYLSIRNKLAQSLGRVPFADPYVALPLRITNYFVLNAGEQRVRFVTAFCNVGNTDPVSLAVGDLTDPGDALEFFNPLACTGGFGFGGTCFGLDRMNWYGYQGDDVAYGYAPYKAGSPLIVEPQNATLSVAGITGSVVGANGIVGLASWVQPSTATPRDGELRIPAGGKGSFARDFWVAHTLGEIGTLVETTRKISTLSTLTAVVRDALVPVAGARVALESDSGRMVMTTGADGSATVQLPARVWKLTAWKDGHAPTATTTVDLGSVSNASFTFDLPASHTLTVTSREANGGPMPAKVTVLCVNGPCTTTRRSLVPFADVPKDPLPDSVALVGAIPAGGSASFVLPADHYVVLVSRGPEYSIFPNDYPASPGTAVDLTQADATVNATLAHVLDTTGWMSADFHVHAVNSPDSIVRNDARALSFAADGVDVIVSTDHDVVTDYGPIIARLGLSPFLATIIGEEVSPMEWGHYNAFPLTLDATDRQTGGAIDWAGGDGPTLTVGQIFAAMRAKGATTVHFNHARGSLGGLDFLQADLDTLATHADPASFRMSSPGATATDTRLLSSDFNALEIFNPGEDLYDPTSTLARAKFNDWFTLLSRGFKVAGTGVSDTHTASLMTGWRTWVQVGVDSPAAFVPAVMSDRLNSLQAVTSNGPFVGISAARLDAAGTTVVTMPVGIGQTVAQGTGDLQVQVTVQVPTYLDVTKVELYLHTPNDDLSCPIDLASPRAATTRVSCNGQANSNWAASSIAASQPVTLGPADLEVVTTEAGVVYRRYKKVITFRVPAPTTDNWLVAMVYGSKTLAPLLYPPPSGGKVTPTIPFAFTNPIFIDADGNGFDHPPFKASAKHVAPPSALVGVPLPGDVESIRRRWGETFSGQ